MEFCNLFYLYLASNILVGKSDDHAVFWGVVFVLVLDDQALTSKVVSTALWKMYGIIMSLSFSFLFQWDHSRYSTIYKPYMHHKSYAVHTITILLWSQFWFNDVGLLNLTRSIRLNRLYFTIQCHMKRWSGHSDLPLLLLNFTWNLLK